MNPQNHIKLQFTAADATSAGEARTETWSKERAMSKAVKIWLGCWGLALLSLPIPILHFLTVPSLLVLGPVAGIVVFRVFNGSVDIVEGSGSCPTCRASITLEKRSANWPLQITCNQCAARISVSQP